MFFFQLVEINTARFNGEPQLSISLNACLEFLWWTKSWRMGKGWKSHQTTSCCFFCCWKFRGLIIRVLWQLPAFVAKKIIVGVFRDAVLPRTQKQPTTGFLHFLCRGSLLCPMGSMYVPGPRLSWVLWDQCRKIYHSHGSYRHYAHLLSTVTGRGCASHASPKQSCWDLWSDMMIQVSNWRNPPFPRGHASRNCDFCYVWLPDRQWSAPVYQEVRHSPLGMIETEELTHLQGLKSCIAWGLKENLQKPYKMGPYQF